MAERYWDRERDWDRGRRHRAEGYDDVRYDVRDREREYDRRIDERGFLDRLRDEVRSWFNDEREERRRREDERGRWGGTDEGRDWARQWGYVEGHGLRRPERDWAVSRTGPEPYGARTEPRGLGLFAGRGPRGYRRSDERIREDVCDRMCDNAELDASNIEIVVVGGEVTLTGAVHDRYDKRLAEDLSQSVSGVRDVHNQLRVSARSTEQHAETQASPGDPSRYRAA